MKTAIVFLILTSGLVAADDNYERSRQCAAQAEKTASRKGLHLLQSHYSPKYQKCFITAEKSMKESQVFFTVLADAYENVNIAIQIYDYDGNGEVVLRCAIYDDPKPCQAVYDFIVERMDH